MSKIHEVLFQSKARVKLIKFLLRSGQEPHSPQTIARRIQELPSTVAKELKNLEKISLVKAVKRK
ncbi:MAG: hypothetical protein COV31_02830 [Candidatus Yanofskybacteria bacterium CG10_big_fil_rev_8_21_14_0_10_46_23]|uniref:HTH arsR-type domain-containing protein n=1 Tax=Candidatus Yanofskybacteria bacterium CG10_big_fil_rev_8_21_14_0_10_46_23 TaxID=1975098 RepID=A0A2H0R3R2_9BACT|nr:MAG: hypothetical protein COV31_02830 [Candidatus Yanofskybacteria bacterium CG10_big_fil_rev_8_21_14_0_10_46_23]